MRVRPGNPAGLADLFEVWCMSEEGQMRSWRLQHWESSGGRQHLVEGHQGSEGSDLWKDVVSEAAVPVCRDGACFEDPRPPSEAESGRPAGPNVSSKC